MGPYNEHLLLQTNFDLSSFSLILGVWGIARAPAKGPNPWIIVGTDNMSFLYLITFFKVEGVFKSSKRTFLSKGSSE